jgi:tetratricopeptide (TPR) repeat protein
MNPDQWIKAEQRRRAIMAQYAQDNHAAAACAVMQRLAAKHPALPGIQADLMALAYALCEYRTALAAADRLLALAPAQPAAVHAAAEMFLLCGQPDKAAAAWHRLEKSPQRHAAWLGLARLSERAGRVDEAAKWTEQALAASPGEALALIQAARIARRRGQHADAARILEPCTAERVPPAIRADALYEAGELHDAAGDCAAAASAWRAAKRCMEAAWPAQVQPGRRIRERVIQRNRDLIASLDPAVIRRWRSAPPQEPRTAILAGHPRSGTTLLEQVLAAHPQIHDVDEKDALACAVRETLFPRTPSGPDMSALDAASDDSLATVRRDYLRRLAMLGIQPAPDALILDKNPNLTDFLPFLLRPLPGARLLVARRDPRDVVLSCFRLPVRPESGNIGWLREADTAEDYQSMMSVWLRLRECLCSNDGWMEVHYEDLCRDFDTIARRVTSFLRLEWHAAQSDYRQTRAGERVASPSYESVRAPVHTGSIGRWQRYADHLPELFAPFD